MLGYDDNKSDWTFQNNLMYTVLKVVCDYSDGRPALVFVNSRAQSEKVALHILQKAAQRFVLGNAHGVSEATPPCSVAPEGAVRGA